MALFSRTKSKAKKFSEQEVPKAAEGETTTTPDDAPQRGRKGKQAVRPSQYDSANAVPLIPGHSLHLRSSNHNLYGSRSAYDRSNGHEGSDYLIALNGKQHYSESHSSSDSGYSSAGPQSRSLSRAPTMQREMGCFQISNKSMTQLGLGEDIAREPASSARSSTQGDAIDYSSAHRSKAAERKPLNTSRSLQSMRAYFRPDRAADTPLALPPQNRYQDARCQHKIQQSMSVRPPSVLPQSLRSTSERMSRPLPQCSSTSSGPMLQSSRSAYALRSLAAVPSSSRLPYDWSDRIPSNLDQQLQATTVQPRSPTSPTSHRIPAHAKSRQDESTPPLSILDGLKVNKRGLILDEEGDPIGELYEGDIIDCVREKADAYGAVLDECEHVVGRVRTLSRKNTEPTLRLKASSVEKLHGFPLPPVSKTSSATKFPKFDDTRSFAQDQTTQTQKRVTTHKGGPSSLSRAKSSLRCRESVEQNFQSPTPPRSSSLASNVSSQGKDHEQTSGQQESAAPRPRLHGRSESLPSVPESHSTAEIEPSDDGSFSSDESQQERVTNGTPSKKRLRATSSARTEPHRRYPIASHSRSVSDPMHLTTALPPVPFKGKQPLELKKAKVSVLDITTTSAHNQRAGLTSTPSRAQSLPEKSPGAPVPGMPSRRLTTHVFPTSSPSGSASLNTQPPILRPRASGTIPLVRSPLSSQGTKLSSMRFMCVCSS